MSSSAVSSSPIAVSIRRAIVSIVPAGVLADGVERALLAPAGHVGHALAGDVEPGRAADDVGDAVDEDLGLLSAVLAVADAERVRQLMDEHADLRVGREVLVDDDLHAVWVAPAVGAAVERQVPDAVAELPGEVLERRQQARVAVTADRRARRLERDRVAAGQRIGLGDVEHGDRAEDGAALVLVGVVGVALADRHRGEDPDGLLALAHAAVELQERAKAGHERGVGLLPCDQHLVAERVARQAVGRAHAQPALPAVG